MELGIKVKLDAVLKAYPFAEDFVKEKWPIFKKLDNPMLRKALGKKITVGQAAAMAGVDADVLINEVADEIEKQSGTRPEII